MGWLNEPGHRRPAGQMEQVEVAVHCDKRVSPVRPEKYPKVHEHALCVEPPARQ